MGLGEVSHQEGGLVGGSMGPGQNVGDIFCGLSSDDFSVNITLLGGVLLCFSFFIFIFLVCFNYPCHLLSIDTATSYTG